MRRATAPQLPQRDALRAKAQMDGDERSSGKKIAPKSVISRARSNVKPYQQNVAGWFPMSALAGLCIATSKFSHSSERVSRTHGANGSLALSA
jgi:hypothetical protein